MHGVLAKGKRPATLGQPKRSLNHANAYHHIAFSPAVKAMRTAEGSREIDAKYEASPKAMKTEVTGPEMAQMGARIAELEAQLKDR